MIAASRRGLSRILARGVWRNTARRRGAMLVPRGGRMDRPDPSIWARLRTLGRNFEELALAGLNQRSSEPLRRQLQVVDGLAVDLDPSLFDHAAPVAVRLAELRLQQPRQINVSAVDAHLGDVGLVRRPALADDAREVVLATLG